jgi:hypothetical protein
VSENVRIQTNPNSMIFFRYLSILSVSVFLSSALLSQDKKDLKISIGTGILNSPYYTNANARQMYDFSLEYAITKKHKITSDYLSGKHFYYDNVRSNNAVPLNTPGYEKNANATAEYSIFSLLYKYLLFQKRNLSISTGTGLGIMTQVMEYPYTEGNIVDFRQASWTDICFPIRIDFDYKISKKIEMGLIGGFYIHPDYPILGYHTGIRLSYIVK